MLLALATSLFARDKIAYIEFFGYQGIDLAAVRNALPFREGDGFSPALKEQALAAVKGITDVAATCCIGDGDYVIFIGLPGASSRVFKLNPAPHGDLNLAPELSGMHERMRQAEVAAITNGAAEQDGSPGYRLMKEPAARAAELVFRQYALRRERELIRVLESSRHAGQRAIAADALGYCARSERQTAALVRAVRDPDSSVRNNATRALYEILRADPAASGIPPDSFIDMVRSGFWTDRNKGTAALAFLTQSRDPRLLARLKAEAGDALLEIARWHGGWAIPARIILARIAGVPEERISPSAGIK